MFRIAFAFALVLSTGSLLAHHGYADYDRQATVEMEGTIRGIVWANPHVVFTIDTGSAGEYRVEWWDKFRLSGQGMSESPVSAGDRVVVIASVNRNPERRILTLVREIRRPADGWRWVDPRRR